MANKAYNTVVTKTVLILTLKFFKKVPSADLGTYCLLQTQKNSKALSESESDSTFTVPWQKQLLYHPEIADFIRQVNCSQN